MHISHNLVQWRLGSSKIGATIQRIDKSIPKNIDPNAIPANKDFNTENTIIRYIYIKFSKEVNKNI